MVEPGTFGQLQKDDDIETQIMDIEHVSTGDSMRLYDSHLVSASRMSPINSSMPTSLSAQQPSFMPNSQTISGNILKLFFFVSNFIFGI